MSKVAVQTIDNLQNETSAIGRINSNFVAIQTVIETLLSRNGAAPNQMVSLLDMNNQKVINLPYPTSDTEPARHGDINQYVTAAAASATAADASADAAAVSETNAATSASEAASSLIEFEGKFLGSFSSDPVLDPNGNPLKTGAIYFNTSSSSWRAYSRDEVFSGTDPVYVNSDRVVVQSWISIPSTTFKSLTDVSADSISNGQFIVYSGGSFIPLTLTASGVPYSGSLQSTNVADALDEIQEGTLFDRYDISLYIHGLLTEGDNLYRLPVIRPFTIPSDTTGFIANAAVASTGTVALTLKKNGIQFGTVTFTSSSTGVWSIPGSTSFVAGDILSLSSPETVDTTLKDIGLSLLATR